MSRQANPTLIGAFVLGAVALLVTAVLLFGSMKLFSDNQLFIVYFDESVNGLAVGAPVKLRGVPIGEVKEIRLRHNQSEATTAVPVFVEIDLGRLERTLGVSEDLRDEAVFRGLIRDGLRAKLELVSFITGLYFIELDFERDAGRAVFYQKERLLPEIPSMPSAFAGLGQSASDIMARIGQIDVLGISNELLGVLKRTNAAIDAFAWAEINRNVVDLTSSLTERVRDPRLDALLRELELAAGSVRALAGSLDAETGPTAAELRRLSEELRVAVAEGRALLDQAGRMMEPESSFRSSFEGSLRDVGGAAEALRVFLEYLERNPSSLLTGRPEAEPAKR